MQKIT